MNELILGIDGGGSRTRVLLADRSGSIIGSGAAGSSNYQAVGFSAATQALLAAIAEARYSAGVPDEAPVAAACFGLAGVGRPLDQARFLAWGEQHNIARMIHVVNDAELLLAGGTAERWGVALICGTGSICHGRAPDGRTARSGGWGYLLGDEGSGHAIASHALRLATQTADGRAQAPGLLRLALEYWGLAEPPQLITHVYQGGVSRTDIAALAGPVAALAEEGDPGAQQVIDQAGADLATMVAAVVRALDLQRPPVALSGGVILSSKRLRASLGAHSKVELGDITRVDDPTTGAVVIARHMLAEEARTLACDSATA